MSGSKPGERRGGRRKGTPNKATADIKVLAQQYTPAAIERLAVLGGLVNAGEGIALSEQAQVGALKELIDRGHGKAPQYVEAKVNVHDNTAADALRSRLAELADRALRRGAVDSGSVGDSGQPGRLH